MILPQAFHGHPAFTATWIVVYLGCFVPEVLLSRRFRSKEGAHRADRGSMVLVIVAANLAVGGGFALAALLPRYAFAAGWRYVFSLGIVIWIGGTLFRWYAMRVLGRFFTFDVALSEGQHVIEAGPYRRLRHPSYLGALLAQLGFGLTLTNKAAVLLPPLCLGLAFLYRMHVEEQCLLKGLGAPYQDYVRRTWRLIPFVY